MSNLYERVLELHRVLEILTDDLARLRPLLGDRSPGAETTLAEYASRRSYVRAFFALVEALVEQQAHILVALGDDGFIKLSPGTRAALSDTAYEVRDNGAIRECAMRLTLRRKIRALYRAADTTLDQKTGAKFDGQGWRDFDDALQVRHALTHPKTSGDCFVEEEDLLVVERALAWHTAAHNGLTEALRLHREVHGW